MVSFPRKWAAKVLESSAMTNYRAYLTGELLQVIIKNTERLLGKPIHSTKTLLSDKRLESLFATKPNNLSAHLRTESSVFRVTAREKGYTVAAHLSKPSNVASGLNCG